MPSPVARPAGRYVECTGSEVICLVLTRYRKCQSCDTLTSVSLCKSLRFTHQRIHFRRQDLGVIPLPCPFGASKVQRHPLSVYHQRYSNSYILLAMIGSDMWRLACLLGYSSEFVGSPALSHLRYSRAGRYPGSTV